MASSPVALDVASFLDSPQAAALAAPAREDVRRIAEAFLTACYEGVGTAPHKMDGDDLHAVVGHLLPAHFKRRDPLAEHVPAVLAAYLDHLDATRSLSQGFELRRALERTAPEFQEAVRTGEAAHHHAPRQEPVVHRAPKLGRNDPCFCGSGKKFKKCCGKGA